jgi:hypothetical protein
MVHLTMFTLDVGWQNGRSVLYAPIMGQIRGYDAAESSEAHALPVATGARLARRHLPALMTPSGDRQRNSLRTRDHVFNAHSFVGLMGEIGVTSWS